MTNLRCPECDSGDVLTTGLVADPPFVLRTVDTCLACGWPDLPTRREALRAKVNALFRRRT